MSKKIFPILIVLITLCFSRQAIPATYYIDYAGGNNSNNGLSSSAPWQMCPGMKGFTGSYSHQTGDKFIFKGGVTWPAKVFPMTIRFGGIKNNPDVYAGGQMEVPKWGNTYPVFDGQNTGNFQSGLINQKGTSHITLDGIKIVNVGHKDGSGQAIFFVGGSGITVKNCWLQPNGINAFAYSAASGTYSKVYFHDNIIKQAGRIHVSVGNAICDDFQFYNNTMYGQFDYDPKFYHLDGFMIGADGVGSWKATNLKIYNNRFLGDWRRSATAMIYINGTPNKYYSWQNVYIYNNQLTTENDSGSALSPSLGVFVMECDNIKVYNNTLDGRALSRKSSHGIFFAYRNSSIDIRNNIISGVDNAITFGNKTTGTIIIGNNLFYDIRHLLWDGIRAKRYDNCSEMPSAYKGTYCSVSDPKFIKRPSSGIIDSGNWQLQPDSPAVNNGINLSEFFTTDLLGSTRGKRWHIGAFEK